jgi:multiple sugar transport system permease protein
VRLSRQQQLLLFGPLVLLLAVGLLGPSVLGFLATFTSYAPGQGAIRFIELANYIAVLRDGEFMAAVRNIVVFTALAVPLELVIGFGLAYILRRPMRGRAILRVLLLIPWLVSPVASGVMWHFLLGPTHGLLDFALGLIGLPDTPSPLGQHGLALLTVVAVEVWRVAPLAGFLLVPGLAAIPPQNWEHATIEGSSWIGQIRHVALPAIRPLMLAVTLLLVGAALGTFDTVLILTGGGPGTETSTPGLYSYTSAFQAANWPVGAASAWLIVAAVLAAGAAYLRFASTDEP